ncbi:MAG: DNA-directed RNA polymerase subunit H [Candidatus Nanoarchaeia archaeon]|nr:DNA-directed RNA polymerase subunit H [Candidatus Haiyanarchaeum thermophilum]MCW1303076.1 DNA-directed RNA polymerase subunit H [Candidatus Haiyanarchaeum thermophilum]MCW1303741.1 DNA-directed RNA polymerase subunit H [Candidatus Haiyanarchaeum thermophilum]MCW1306814.1 DNA-directed RNA polymerase subunit H [Candidatus Haiyanarchaeum thermophilum]MCW1307056.1 DNA-directed RNA polymerase subunit H [Candidatus Haiyanarchaeum thermophilum]
MIEERDKEEFDIFTHRLVPRHRIISEEEKRELLTKYNAKLADLPRILITDPVVRKLGAKPGDVIEITRSSPTAGETKYYRVVIVE